MHFKLDYENDDGFIYFMRFDESRPGGRDLFVFKFERVSNSKKKIFLLEILYGDIKEIGVDLI